MTSRVARYVNISDYCGSSREIVAGITVPRIIVKCWDEYCNRCNTYIQIHLFHICVYILNIHVILVVDDNIHFQTKIQEAEASDSG